MKHFLFVFAAVLIFTGALQAQDQYVKHKVAKSETVTQIAQKYKVTPFDIYRLNPDARSGVREDDIILIASPSVTKSTTTTTTPGRERMHVVQPKETLFSIARDYNVSVNDLRNANPTIVGDSLKSGESITVPSNTSTVATRTVTSAGNSNSAVVYHVVEPGQTKYSIAKKYGITVADLERQNPSIVDNLPSGYKLTISGSAAIAEKPKPAIYEIPKTSDVQTERFKTILKTPYANYEVKPKETLYSLSQMFNLSQTELIELNPTLRDGVKIGMILKVPGLGSMVMAPRKDFKDLLLTANTVEKKELVLLLPFNASKIKLDSLNSVANRLKSDAFLNMTLDFYSGALMAIDSAKALSLNVNVRIFDSEENRSSSNVENLIRNNNIRSADAVIGPFYQQHLEKAAALLQNDSIPVISPLSKETGKPYPNLFQAMPPGEATKSALLNYMLSKNGNIIMISDPKKQANRDFVKSNYPQIRFAELNENDGLVAESLRKQLVPGRKNYVILDSERTGMILSATNVLLNEMGKHDIQLAILEPNETLNFEEISMKRLTVLKMLYPSLIRQNTSEAALAFDRNYKKKNNASPNAYAT
nr:LysM peptidoglycan-binding domain-containing protein [Flavobacterium sp.]